MVYNERQVDQGDGGKGFRKKASVVARCDERNTNNLSSLCDLTSSSHDRKKRVMSERAGGGQGEGCEYQQ